VPLVIKNPDIEPSEIPTTAPIVETTAENEILLTIVEEKPEVLPELPETAHLVEQTGEATLADVQAHEALDPALKNPDVKPNTTNAPLESAKPKETIPQGGVLNENGEIYVHGFGWTKHSGPNEVKQSGSDGDWGKIIGKFN